MAHINSSSSDQAVCFANVVLVRINPETGVEEKATLGGIAVKANDKRPSKSSDHPFSFVQNFKANAKCIADGLEPGESKVIMEADAFEQLRSARGYELRLEVRDPRPAEEEATSETGLAW